MRIETERFLIRKIQLEDANSTYLGWLKDGTSSKHINTASEIEGLEELKNYVSLKIANETTLFLAIVDKSNNAHIGNIKFEPIDTIEKRTFLGVFIGEAKWRGKGVFGEVFSAISSSLFSLGVRQVYLGVKDYNQGALKAYLKSGFIVTRTGLVTGENGIELCYTIES